MNKRYAVINEATPYYNESDAVWNLKINLDLDKDGTYQILVDTSGGPPPDGLVIVEDSGHVTNNNHTIWRVVYE